jgi:hypothetical protein
MDVSAAVADQAESRYVGPVEIEKRGGRCVQLPLAAQELVVSANVAAQRLALNFIGLWSYRFENAHRI